MHRDITYRDEHTAFPTPGVDHSTESHCAASNGLGQTDRQTEPQAAAMGRGSPSSCPSKVWTQHL